MGCLFIQYKFPPNILKYSKANCWYSIPRALKKWLAIYSHPTHIFFFPLSPSDIETRNKAPGHENMLNNNNIPWNKLCLFQLLTSFNWEANLRCFLFAEILFICLRLKEIPLEQLVANKYVFHCVIFPAG